MSAFTNLINSDTLFFNSINYNLNGPSQINPGPRFSNNFCVSKIPGQLRFKLNTINELGFDKPFDFDIEFIGQFAGNDQNGNTLIQWNVDQKVDKDFKKSGFTVHIDKVEGNIMSLILARDPRSNGQDCQGNLRSTGVDMQTQSNTNTLKIPASVLSTGLHISADNITWVVEGRDQFSIDAKINAIKNECGIGGIVPGGTVKFWAQVNNIPAGDSVAYKWSVSGASKKGKDDQSNFQVQLGNDETPITVQVVITVEGVSEVIKIKYKPDTQDSVRIKQILCRVISELHVNLFVNPLYDPLRDYVNQPLVKSELSRIAQFANSLIKGISSLSELK